MKLWMRMLVLTLCLLLLAGCGGDDVRGAERQIKASERYDEAAIADAMDVVEAQFQKGFRGCTLLTIVYDEEATARAAEREQKKYGKDTIILTTDFQVDDSGASPSLNPGTMYRNYEWVLVRTWAGWKLKNSGYA